jgi:glycosyltransferase involved in cell wall biosynthesis
VLQLVSSAGFFGAERVLLELALDLRAQGWEVEVGALQAPGMERVDVVDRAREAGLRTVLFPCRGGFDARAMAGIRDHVRQRGISVVHGHGYKSNIYLFLALGARGPARLVSTCHNWLTDSIKLMIYELFDKLVLHQFHHVVAVSPPLERELAAAGIDARSVIDNGLDLEGTLGDAEREALRGSLGVPADRLMLLAIGRLDRWKAYDRLLEAMARLDRGSGPHLVLVGDGELHGELEAQARRLGVRDRVTFAGYRRDVGRLLQAADLFVISSRKEGLPMVLLEAMAARLPVVATRVGAIPDALGDGRDGLLVPPEDPAALAAAIETLARAPERRAALAHAAGRAHAARFSRRAMGRRYIELYRHLLEDRRTGGGS